MMKPVLALLFSVAICHADINVVTHFENPGNAQYNAPLVVPVLQQLPFIKYVRDDVNWRKYELTQGVYALDQSEQVWIDALAKAGYTIVFDLNYGPDPNITGGNDYIPFFYPDPPYPAQAATNFLKWFVQTETARGVKLVIELINEPNNAWQGKQGANWETALVNFSNMAADAIHSLNLNVPVIGLGAQGQQILDMLAITPTHLDGIVYHPYDAGDGFAEEVFEGGTISNPAPWRFNYIAWVQALRSWISAHPPANSSGKLTLNETELGDDNNPNGDANAAEYHSALWDVRRIVLSTALGIDHTFFHAFSEHDNEQSVVDYNRLPRFQFFAIRRAANFLAGLTTNTPATVSSGVAAFDSNTYGYAFSNAANTSWVTIAWAGNAAPTGAVVYQTTPCTVSWNSTVAPGAVDAVNLASGDPVNVTASSYNGTQVTVTVPVGADPVAIFPVSGGAPTPTPTPKPTPTPTPTTPPTAQTGTNQYGQAATTSLSYTFTHPEIAGDTVVVYAPHGSTLVADNAGNTFTNTFTQSSDGRDIWKATNIKGTGWNVTTYANFPSTVAPSITVTEYTGSFNQGGGSPTPTPTATPTPVPTPTPTPVGVQPSVSIPATFTLKWNQDFTAASYRPFNTAAIISPTGPPGSIWRAPDGVWANQMLFQDKYVDGDPFSIGPNGLNIHGNGGANPPYGGGIFSGTHDGSAGFYAGTPSGVYWEAKIKYPAPGSERVPIWVVSWGDTTHSPNGVYGEIDVMEFGSQINLHVYPGSVQVGSYSPPNFDPTIWHIIGVLIQPDGTGSKIDVYDNGVLVHEFAGLSAAFLTPGQTVLWAGFGYGLPQTGNPGWTFDVGCQYIRCWSP